MRKNWKRWCSVLVAAATLACGGGEGSGGEPEENQQQEPGEPACVIQDLGERCAMRDCPTSPEDLTPFCTSDFRGTTRITTACDTTMIFFDYGLGWTKYEFSAEGDLIAITSFSDKGMTCRLDGMLLSNAYGTPCREKIPVDAPRVDLCEAEGGTAGAGGSP